jgi:orotate phosphoribosyltransferase
MSLLQDEFLERFTASNALMEGHFKLSSGRHSDRYLQCARLLQYPEHARAAGVALARLFCDIEVDAVIAPAIGGILVAHELACNLGVRALFGERQEGVMSLRRGFQIAAQEKLIVVEDVITTGKSTREVLELVNRHQGVTVGIGALADRSGGKIDLPLPVYALLTLDIESWDPEICPLCKNNTPLNTPGSRFKR